MGHPFSPEALPLMEAVFREVLRAGGHPYPYVEARHAEGLNRIFYEEGSDDQLRYLEPWAEQMTRSRPNPPARGTHPHHIPPVALDFSRPGGLVAGAVADGLLFQRSPEGERFFYTDPGHRTARLECSHGYGP